MDIKLTIPTQLIIRAAQRIIKWARKVEVKRSGSINFSRVINQGSIEAFLLARGYRRNNLKVRELPDYFRDFAKHNITNYYLVKDEKYHKDLLPREDKYKVLINDTRISTFFCFTDGESVLLFDRAESKLQEVENNYWDCFGSVTFENISIKIKIDPDSTFFDSEVEAIEFIPGVAYEDNVETEDNLLGCQTVIMFGFVIYVSTPNLRKALSNKNPYVKSFQINGDAISNNILTSKADISLAYLRERHA